MEQVGQRKIDGTVADGGRHCGAVLFDLAHAYRDPDVVFGGLLSRVPANVILVSLVHGLFHVPEWMSATQDVSDCGGDDHRDRYAFRITLCLWPALFHPADQEPVRRPL